MFHLVYERRRKMDAIVWDHSIYGGDPHRGFMGILTDM